ncbi:hypothetical protein M404DRAFT_995056 [Pisolithus tinctorius Marx 270]|uniref:Uncharacterized protein n=1 Tax=Pisolithus tinctorius Marx 270 TaxID=870435 RepID=A0A0C3PQX1_PISTI|nr:hypothetical protein M404DRAFT_995056 [Pisolithus tinctorius Marx 270]
MKWSFPPIDTFHGKRESSPSPRFTGTCIDLYFPDIPVPSLSPVQSHVDPRKSDFFWSGQDVVLL